MLGAGKLLKYVFIYRVSEHIRSLGEHKSASMIKMSKKLNLCEAVFGIKKLDHKQQAVMASVRSRGSLWVHSPTVRIPHI